MRLADRHMVQHNAEHFVAFSCGSELAEYVIPIMYVYKLQYR